jgi:hypothetical protein
MHEFRLLSGAAGLTAGLFLGLLIGLSRSPIVGAAITALVPLVGLIVSRASKGKEEKPLVPLQDTLSFVSVFFAAAIVALMLGLWVRTSSTPIVAFKGDLLAAGFSEEKAKELIAESLRKGALVPANTSATALYSAGPSDRTTVAEPARSGGANCSDYNPGLPPYNAEAIAGMRQSRVAAWRDAGELLEALGRSAEAATEQGKALQTRLRRLVCGD